MTTAEHRVEFAFEDVKQAIKDAFSSYHYDELDRIVSWDVNAFARVRHGRTPMLAAMDELFAEQREKEREGSSRDIRLHHLNLVVDVLDHVLTRAHERLGEDHALTGAFVHAGCNHIARSGFLRGGGTLADLLEGYFHHDGALPDAMKEEKLQDFMERWKLEGKSVIAQERLSSIG